MFCLKLDLFQLASLLAEQEQSKPEVESEDEELDLDLLRAQALKSVEPKTTKKRKSAGSTEDGEIVEEVYKGGKYTTAVFKRYLIFLNEF